MDTRFLERRIDEYLVKEAARQTLGGAALNTVGYMMPVVGAGMSIRDGMRDFRKGRIWSGIGNTALGITTGALDIASILASATGVGSVAGVPLAGASGALRSARAAKAIGAAAKVSRAVIGAKNTARVGQAVARGANGYFRAFNAANRAVANGSAWAKGMAGAGKSWMQGRRAYQGMVNGARWLQNSGRVGRGVVNAGKWTASFVPKAAKTGYNWTLGWAFNPARTLHGRGIGRALVGEKGIVNYGLNTGLRSWGNSMDENYQAGREIARQHWGGGSYWGGGPYSAGSRGRYSQNTQYGGYGR